MFRSYSLTSRIVSVVISIVMVWTMSPGSALADTTRTQSSGSQSAATQPATVEQSASETETAEKTPATIHFDANGGNGSAADVAIADSSSFDQKLAAASITRDGYVFAGWSTTADDKDAKDASGTVTMPAIFVPDAASISTWKFSWDADNDGAVDPDTETFDLSSCVKDGTLTLYAQWARKTTTIRFDANGASSGTMADETFAWDTATVLSSNEYARDGYRFVGWSTTADGKSVADDPATTADESFLATSVVDGAQILRNIASYDSDGDGTPETFDLSYAATGAEAESTITLYAQWEQIPDAIAADENATVQDQVADATATAATAEVENEQAAATSTGAEASGLVAESDADHLKNAAPATTNSGNKLADVRDADNGGADDLQLKVADTSAVKSLAQSFMSLLSAPDEATETAPADNPSQDGASIKDLTVSWLTSGTVSSADPTTTVFTPSDNGKQVVKGQIYLSLDSNKNYEAGAVHIVVPGHIFTGRDGSKKGNLVLPVAENPSTKTEFNWSYDAINDTYTLTSTREMSGRSEITFQFGFENLTPSDLVDAQASGEFLAKAYVTNSKGNLLTKTSNSIKAAFDTHETLKSAKIVPNGQVPWETKVPASQIPEDKRIDGVSEYLVVSYYTYAYHEGNTAYSLGWTAQDLGAYDKDGNKVADGVVISGDTGTETMDGWAADGNTGYRQVKVAYPFSAFAVDADYTLKVSADWALTETDTQAAQSLTAEARVAFAWHNPRPVAPGGHYGHMNWGDDNDSAFTFHASRNGFQYDYSNRDFHIADLVEGYYGIYRTALNDLAAGDGATVRYQKYLRGYMLADEHNQGSSDYTKKSEFTSPVSLVVQDGDYSFAQNAANPSYQGLEAGTDYDITSVLVCKPTSVWKATEVDASNLQESNYLYENGTDQPYYYDPGTKVSGGTYGVAYEKTDDLNYYPTTVIEAEVDGQWQTVGTVDWKTADSDKVSVSMPAGTQNWRATVNSDSIGAEGEQCAAIDTEFVCPTVVLHPTDKVKQLAESAISDMTTPECLLQSEDSFNASNAAGTTVYSTDVKATDNLFGYNSNVMAVPSSSATASAWDETNTKVTLSLSGEVQEETSVLDKETWAAATSQGKIASETSGTWYDLLPQGAVADLSTIQLRDGDSVQDAYTIDDYNGSGRQLLVVKALLTPQPQYQNRNGVRYVEDVPSISFKASYSMSSYLDYGQNLHNVVVFESGNDLLGNVEHYTGMSDDPTKASSSDVTVKDLTDSEKAILKNLDSTTDKAAFAYAAASVNIGAYTYTHSGFDKQVDVNGEQDYGYGTTDGEKDVYLGSNYTYRLSYVAASGSYQGLAMYDRLENPVAGTIPTGTESWRGTFVSVDTSRLEAMGIAPVVYYSTASDLELATNSDEGAPAPGADLTNSSLWSTTAPDDLSTVTAIAIDCSKTTDGSAFVIQQGQSLAAFVSMRAPFDSSKTDLRAYNDAYFSSQALNSGKADAAVMTHKGHTEVALKPYKLNVTTTWNDDGDRDGVRPTGEVVLHLYANGEPATDAEGNELTYTIEPKAFSDTDPYICSQDGGTVFGNLPVTDASGKTIHYTASITDENGSAIPGYTQSASFGGKDESGNQTLALTQTHIPAKTSISGNKTWSGDNADIRPATVRINLLADGKTAQTKQIVESASGEWAYSFDNVNKYENHGQEIAYTVSESGASDYALAITPTASGFDLANMYHPYGNLTISKTVSNGTDKTAGQKFTFHVALTNSDGSDYTDGIQATKSDGTAVTLVNGGTIELADGESCTLNELPKGTAWTVSEDAVDGYTADATQKSGTIKPNSQNAAAFANDYKTTAGVTLQAKKTLSGRDIQYGQFTFELKDADGTLVRSAANDENGNVAFGALYFSNADSGKTFTYTISERNAGKGGYTYDGTTYGAEVTPTDKGDGTMDVAVKYYKVEADGSMSAIDGLPTFANEYHASGSVTLTAYKQLKGRDLQGGDFTFDLHDAATGKVIATAQNDASGKIDFKPDAVSAYIANNDVQGVQDLSYKESDRNQTYAYYVTEEKGTDKGVTYSTEVFAWTVAVQDDGDGHLSETTTNVGAEGLLKNCSTCNGTGTVKAAGGTETTCEACNGTGKDANAVNADWTAAATTTIPLFTNTLKPGALSIEKEAVDAPEGDQTPFTFDVDVKDADGRPLESGDVAYTVEDVNSSASDAASAQSDASAAATASSSSVASGNPITNTLQSLASLLQPQKAYADETDSSDKSYTITYEANGGQFSDGSTENKVTYSDRGLTTKYVHMSNLDDNGDSASGFDGTVGYENTQSVTIEGAQKLTIDVWYATRSSGSWLSIYPSGIDPSSSNPAQSVTGELYGGENYTSIVTKETARHCKVEVDGDTAQFYFKNDPNDGEWLASFGYYAVVTGVGTNATAGSYQEPSASDQAFLGWYSDPECTQSVSDPSQLGHDATVYALMSDYQYKGYWGTCPWVVTKDGDLEIGAGVGANQGGKYNSWTENSPWANYAWDITGSIKAVGPVTMPESCNYLFQGLAFVTSMDFSNFDSSSTTSMYCMFLQCSRLISLDLEPLDTSSVTDMSGMFMYCGSLKSLDVSKFDTSNVTAMGSMFYYCSALEKLDLSSFDTSKVTSFYRMFFDNINLKTLDVSSFKTSSCYYFDYMFAECRSLTSVDVSGFDTSNARAMDYMFENCKALTDLDVSHFDTANVTDFSYMFRNCESLADLDVSHFNTSAGTSFDYMFYDCSKIALLDLSGFTTSGQSRDGFLGNCTSLSAIIVPDAVSLKNGQLPAVPTNDKYTGKWVYVSNPTVKLTSDDLMSKFPSDEAPAGIWEWELTSPISVSFDPNGGSGSMATYQTVSGYVELPECGFYYANHDFTSWNTKPDGTGRTYNPGDMFDTEDTPQTLYAQWKESSNTAKVTDGHFSVTIKAGQKVTISGLPGGATYTVHEHNRAGWVLSSSKNTAGTIPAAGTAQALFTNTYNPKATSVNLTAAKTLDGKAPKDGAYSFTVAPDSETPNAPMPNGASGIAETVTNTGALVESGSIVFENPGVYIYDMKEVAGSDDTIGYDTHTIKARVDVTDPTDKGILVAKVTYSPDDAFVNTTKPGTVTITKKIDGYYPDNYWNQPEFTFNVTLTDSLGQPLSGTYKVTSSSSASSSSDQSVTFTDGTASLTLKAGESKTIASIPAGSKYTVEETNLPASYSLEKAEGAEGSVSANKDSAVVFTNAFSPAPGIVNIHANKVLEGGTLKGDDYEFELIKCTMIDHGGIWLGDAVQTVSNDADGNIDFAPVTVSALSEGSYGYDYWVVREKQPTNPDENVEYSDKTYLLVTTYNTQTYDEEQQKLVDTGRIDVQQAIYEAVVDDDGSVGIKYIDEGHVATADAMTFTNAIKTGSVSLTKKVEGTAAEGKAFDFQVKLTDDSGAPLDGTYTWTSTAADKDGNALTGSVKNGDTLSLAKDETVTIAGVPAGSKYEFTESDLNGYEQTGSENLSGTVHADKTVAATATNTYAASGTAQIKAKKVVLRSGEETMPDDGAFTFTLAGKSDESSDSFDTPVSTATNDAEGDITFKKLVYTTDNGDADKTFTYQIQEVNDGRSNYDYDAGKYLARVTTKDDGAGTLQCTVEYSTDGGTTWTEDVPVFENNTVTRMPVSGESGFAGLIIVGAAILGLSAFAWLRRKRRAQ